MHGFYMLWPKFLPWLNVRFSKCPSEDEKERERERERERDRTLSQCHEFLCKLFQCPMLWECPSVQPTRKVLHVRCSAHWDTVPVGCVQVTGTRFFCILLIDCAWHDS